MKLRYMIDRCAVIENGQVIDYEPIGVWVQGPGPMDIEVYYLPGIVEWDQDGFWVINRLVEQGVKALPPDILEYHRDTQSPYHGKRGPIVETARFEGMQDCGEAILKACFQLKRSCDEFSRFSNNTEPSAISLPTT